MLTIVNVDCVMLKTNLFFKEKLRVEKLCYTRKSEHRNLKTLSMLLILENVDKNVIPRVKL